ncbi:MAG: hypothetical protein FJW69_07180 [Actinobacteria bacterium]|nr:hypothetical protein [Actinomycetota bacterium]
MGRVHFTIKNSAFINSTKKDLVQILLSFILRAKNIFNIFNTINKNKIKAEIALTLCLYTWSAFNVSITRQNSSSQSASGCEILIQHFLNQLLKAGW